MSAYTFNPTTRRYYDSAGHLVPDAAVRALVQAAIAPAEAAMGALTDRYLAGAITRAQWEAALQQQVKYIHVAAVVVAAGGLAQMTPAHWGYAGAVVKSQYAFLRSFATDLRADPPPSDATVAARVPLYANAAYATFANTQTRLARQAGATEERFHLDPETANHCPSCLDRAAQGWQPLGVLSRIGDTDCLTRDRCHVETR